MKYRILLTGNNKPLIDNLFTKPSDHFEFQSTSARFSDIASHIKYFQPHGFLYCLNHELPENFIRMLELKRSPEARQTSFFVIGTKAECDTYMRTAPAVVDLVLEKPITPNAIEEKILAYFSGLKIPAAPSSAPVTPIPIPVSQQQSVDNMVQALNHSQAGSTAQPVKPQTSPAQPASQPHAVNPAQFSGVSQTAGQAQAPGSLQAAGQIQVPNTSQVLGQHAASGQPANNINTPLPAAPASNAQPAKAGANTSSDDNDALLQALTSEIGDSYKMLEAVEDMDLDADPDETANNAAGTRKHILVVDDDSRMLKIIKRHLADKYDVATALNGRVALKFLEKKKTDLILLDYEMPLESGPDVLKKLRDNPYTHDIPVIFLTGISEKDKIQQALVLKPQGYLLKPIDHIKLLSTISRLIG